MKLLSSGFPLNEVHDNVFLSHITDRERTYKKITESLNKYSSEEYMEKYIVVRDGRYIGIYDNIDDAGKAAAKQSAIQCIIATPKEGIKRKQIELGMGVISWSLDILINIIRPPQYYMSI